MYLPYRLLLYDMTMELFGLEKNYLQILMLHFEVRLHSEVFPMKTGKLKDTQEVK